MKTVKIFGVEVQNTTLKETLEKLKKSLKEENLTTIATPNPEIVMACKKDESLSKMINSFDIVVPDGIGLIYASKLKKIPLQERVTGFDISIGLLKLSEEIPFKIFLLGGKPGIAEKAAENIESEYKNVTVCGVHDGYFKSDSEKEIVNLINITKPDVIFVGMGFPKQEKFIYENKDLLDGKIIIGNGGVMDILAGADKRAPEIFMKLNLEWFYRLLKSPSRIKRQMAIPKFILNVLTDKNSVKLGDGIDE